ncbi:hypothetical protein MMC31_004007, partial [Peltigera leucophlebia]|nr:hypothetical protein [Peltigera leucophlebia]
MDVKPDKIAAGSSSTEKYYIYSSKAGKTAEESVQVLTPGTNIDNFVSSLKNQVIILEAAPNPIANFDSSDEWSKWLTKFNPTGKFSLKLDGTTAKNIQSFEFEFAAPWNIKFSSSTEALNFSFGPPLETGAEQARIPVPGISPAGSLLYCGLDLETGVLDSTVKEIFEYVGLADRASSLPTSVSSLPVKLGGPNASKKHNALWFNPSLSSQTTVRLQFQLVKVDLFQDFLIPALPGLEIQTADVICKKVLLAAVADAGPVSVDDNRVMFSVQCSVTPKNNPAINMIAGIELQESAIKLTFELVSPNSLSGILLWLKDLIPDEPIPVEDLINKGDDVFKDVNLRRMTIGLESGENAEGPKLSNFGIDIEISANFGQGSDLKPVVFLVTYAWNNRDHEVGSIRGQLWNYRRADVRAGFDLSTDQDLSPYYEQWASLQPITKSVPATYINLASIIPGHSIDNIPSNIPTQITRAYLSLSETTFAIGGTIKTRRLSQGPIPQPYLGQVKLDASYTWGKSNAFQISLGIMAGLQPSITSKHNEAAVLIGNLDYDSSLKTWELTATLDGLYVSTLYEFFDESSAVHVMPLIDSIAMSDITLDYKYTGKGAQTGGTSVGSYFKLSGALLIADLELDLTFEYNNDWNFVAVLKPQNAQAKLGDIITSILDGEKLDLPDFLADMQFGGEGRAKDNLRIDVLKEKPKPKTDEGSGNGADTGTSADTGTGSTTGSFYFIAEVAIGPLTLTFAQYHSTDWSATVPPKRMVKVTLTKFPEVDVPLIGNLTQPFDEMYYMWIQDATGQNKSKTPGLTRKDIRELNASLSDKLVPKDKFKQKVDSDVLMLAGSHFAMNITSLSGEKTCLLDYVFMKPSGTPVVSSQALGGNSAQSKGKTTTTAAADTDASENSESSAQAPFKKKAGPLSISNIGLKYSEKKLHIMFDATFELGPLGFSLIGLSINLGITSLEKLPDISASIQGMSAVFDKPPLSIAGIIRHGNTGALDYYAGGLIIGFVPYQFEAAGFYGKASPKGAQEFTSVFIFARLDGPLVTLEFAEISGVTGGFGYKSDVRLPSVDQVVNFPFVATDELDGSTGSALETLQRLTSVDANGWFRPLDNTYWAAAGLKVSALKMITLDAAVVVQFGASIKLGIFAVGVVDIPNAKSALKYAHIELGIQVVVDFDYGIFKAEAQLSPNSYIMHPDCHLTGGFGLYYWFDAPHADLSNVGSFVFTMGGYHQAFQIPDGYPNPPRLGISWSLGSDLSITGQAYFAITPKACMGGGRLNATFSAGPVKAWFDAFADFLINYKPFHFTAGAGICIGVSLEIDILFIHIHISIEVSADLNLWGPPVAGVVHVHLWIFSFSISIGDSASEIPAITLIEFYELVLQASSQQNTSTSTAPAAVSRPKNEGHVFLVQSGLINNSEIPEREQNAGWTVRGGTFSFVVSCKMAIDTVKLGDQSITYTTNAVYSRPMKLTNPMSSSLTVVITQDGTVQDDAEWGMEKSIKSVPTGLWASYSPDTDPSIGGKNHVPELLNSQSGGVPLMMGVLLTAPPPIMAPDKLPTFNIEDADLQELPAEKTFPNSTPSHPEWEPDNPQSGAAQWKAVHDNWMNP